MSFTLGSVAVLAQRHLWQRCDNQVGVSHGHGAQEGPGIPATHVFSYERGDLVAVCDLATHYLLGETKPDVKPIFAGEISGANVVEQVSIYDCSGHMPELLATAWDYTAPEALMSAATGGVDRERARGNEQPSLQPPHHHRKAVQS